MSLFDEREESENKQLKNKNDGDDASERRNTYSHTLQLERRTKLLDSMLGLIFIVGLFLFGKKVSNVSGYHLISVVLLMTLLMFIINWCLVLFSFKHLHYIRIRRKKIESSSHLFLPYGYEEDEHTPMTSVSDMMALRGSNVESRTSLALHITFGAVTCAACMKWTESASFRGIDIELILMLISAYCALLLPGWHLEKYSSLSNTGHFIVAMGVLVFPSIAFGLNQHWSPLSITLLCIIYVLIFLWQIVMTFVQRKTYNDNEKSLVHKHSIITIIIEMSAIIFNNVIYVLFVYCLADDVIL